MTETTKKEAPAKASDDDAAKAAVREEEARADEARVAEKAKAVDLAVPAAEDSKFSVFKDGVRPVFRLSKNGFLGDPFEIHVDDIDELIKVLRAAKKS